VDTRRPDRPAESTDAPETALAFDRGLEPLDSAAAASVTSASVPEDAPAADAHPVADAVSPVDRPARELLTGNVSADPSTVRATSAAAPDPAEVRAVVAAPAVGAGNAGTPRIAVPAQDRGPAAERAPGRGVAPAGNGASLAAAPLASAPLASAAVAEADSRPSCTVAQLRRFIKSRPWIPLHELRRRFGIYGGDDDVSPIRVGEHVLFIGLPPAESRLMAELLDGGDVGYELSLDPGAPIVVGVYPMRPVPRG
jgi:hypothetical protein